MRFLINILLLFVAVMANAQVKSGIEVLRDNGFELLKGKRVGLITNPTGVDSQLRSTADILHEAKDVDLVALYAPEHGIRGDIAAGSKVASMTDPVTGVKVWSLYGATRKPNPEMLRGIDALVYDIQDNGCRSYTFISTMGKAMEAAARDGVEFIVLDRPNPLGGNRIEGLITEPDCISFVSQFPIPYIYGMTAGELAQFLVGEKLIEGADKLKLTVVEMDGWERNMDFAATGLPWVPTSPNIPTAETCLLYPATGIAGELSFVSIGIGSPLPFKTFAAPWIDGVKLAERLNQKNIPGVRFRPISFTPSASMFSGKCVGGVEIYITEHEKAQLTMIQFILLDELHKLYPNHNGFTVNEESKRRLRMFDQVCGSKSIRRKFVDSGYKADTIVPLWNKDVELFRQQRDPYIIY